MSIIIPKDQRLLKADLEAARKETESLMQQIRVLNEDAANAYSKGYQDAMSLTHQMAIVGKHQAEMIAYFSGCLSQMEVIKGPNPGARFDR